MLGVGLATSLAVVYLGGTCGQFVRNLLTFVMCDYHVDMHFSKYGSAHFVHLSHEFNEFIDFSELNAVDSTQTHVFTSIPELLPRYDKVVAITITPNCHEEYIIRTINVLMKLNLEEQLVKIDSTQLKTDLERYLGYKYKQLAIDIFNTRYDPEFKEICLYFLFRNMFKNKNEYLFDMEKVWYGNGNIDGCIELSFSVIRNGDTAAFTKFVENVLDKPLSSDQRTYVENMFNKYYNLQDKLLYKDPYEYMKVTSEIALKKLETLKQRYDRYGIY